MTQYFKKILASLDNIINPIAVKEMRQAVRSRYITLLLQLYLLIELLMTGFYLIIFYTNDFSSGGSGLFFPLLVLLFIANLICVPIYTSNRLANEVRAKDAMFSTTLTPMQIVRGKFYCGLIISLLLFSAAAPFIILTYLLRGLDISEILFSLYWAFMSIQVLNCYGIVFGALNINNSLRAVLGSIMGFVIFGFLGNLHYFLSIIPSAGSMDWIFLTILTLFILFLCEAFMTLAACLLSPMSFNRMTRPRIFVTVSSLLFLGASIIFYVLLSDVDFLEKALLFIFGMAIFFLWIGLCERTTLSVRQVQQIPQNPILRILAYPFFTGVGSVIVWFFLMLSIILAVDSFVIQGKFLDSYWKPNAYFSFLDVFMFYTVCGLFIRVGIDAWRRNHLSQIHPDNPEIVIYPSPQKGAITIAYTLFLVAIPTILTITFMFTEDAFWLNLKDYISSYSPFSYLFPKGSDDTTVPHFLRFLSFALLLIYAIFSFARYYLQGSTKTKALKQNPAN